MQEKYIVEAGDTLWGISNQYGVSVTELAALNDVSAGNLKVGQILTIPMKSDTNPDNMFMYTVKKGDTLYAIAKIYNTSVDSIKKLNYLTNDNLYVGQIIRIPEIYNKPDELYVPIYINYIVKSGDTLYSIAKDYNVSVDEIMKDNSLAYNNLSVGQNLKIRQDNSDLEVLECFGDGYNFGGTNSYQTYEVRKGDNLYSIARKYGVSVNDIKSANNLNNDILNIGQILIIPNSLSDIYYTVSRGDTLYSIARKFNTTVTFLKNKNNLKTSMLSVGQILKI